MKPVTLVALAALVLGIGAAVPASAGQARSYDIDNVRAS